MSSGRPRVAAPLVPHGPRGPRSGESIGRYVMFDELAAGGSARVHLGRMIGPVGFAKTVAIKCLHPGLAKDASFASMLIDEARLVARIRHANVVPLLDVVELETGLFLVMEYVHGESVIGLMKRAATMRRMPPPEVAIAIVSGALHGLHAAHEATDELGHPLGIVHRDVSPHNILVGADGVARLVDFGIAKATGRLQSTTEGEVKGKAPYMAPEQVQGFALDRRADVYAAATVLWELSTGRRLFQSETALGSMVKVLESPIAPPSTHNPSLPRALDDVVLRGLARDVEARFQTAREMALALEEAMMPATPNAVARWVEDVAGPLLAERASLIRAIEGASASSVTSFGSTPPPRAAADASGMVSRSFKAKHASRPFVLVAMALAIIGSVCAILVVVKRRPPAVMTVTAATPTITTPDDPPSSAIPPIEPAPMLASATLSATPAPRPQPVPARTGAKTAKPRARDCNPPYTIDAQGVHIPKPECL
jgi:eukaryotic-like serine/threonine-protein kinase